MESSFASAFDGMPAAHRLHLPLAEDEPPPGAAFFPADFSGALIGEALLGGRPARIALASGAQYGFVRGRAFVGSGRPLADLEDYSRRSEPTEAPLGSSPSRSPA